MWAGSLPTLGLSSLAGFLIVTINPDVSLSPALDLLSWVAYLIVPTSLIVVILVLGFTERFRRSIYYTITGEGLVLGGGVGKRRSIYFLGTKSGGSLWSRL